MTPDGVVLFLIGANVAVFVLWGIADPSFMRKHFMVLDILYPVLFLAKFF
jgi:hypothetical protein